MMKRVIKVIESLLGTDVKEKNSDGWTALSLAKENKNKKIKKILVRLGAVE